MQEAQVQSLLGGIKILHAVCGMVGKIKKNDQSKYVSILTLLGSIDLCQFFKKHFKKILDFTWTPFWQSLPRSVGWVRGTLRGFGAGVRGFSLGITEQHYLVPAVWEDTVPIVTDAQETCRREQDPWKRAMEFMILQSWVFLLHHQAGTPEPTAGGHG